MLEILARLPAGPGAGEEGVRLVREVLIGELGGTPDLRGRTPEAPALRMLVEELRTAIVAELGTVDPPPRPASGESPGNVAAALVRWLRAVADLSQVPVASLRAATEPAAVEALTRAREVLLGALAREPRAAATEPTPTYRPDLPVPTIVAREVLKRRGRARARSTPPPDPDEEPAPPEKDAAERAPHGRAAPPADLRGPMDLIRRYFEDFHSPLPGACATHFVYPACAWQAGRWHGHSDAAALAASYESLRAYLAARGVAGGRILMLRVEPIGASVAIVHALMTRESTAARVLEELEVVYTTVRTPTGWRIAVVARS